MEVGPLPEAATFGLLSTLLCSQINFGGKSFFFFFFSCARKTTPLCEITEPDPPAVQETRKRQKYQNIYIFESAVIGVVGGMLLL